LKVDLSELDMVDVTADKRGRVTIGMEYAEKDVKLAIVEVGE